MDNRRKPKKSNIKDDKPCLPMVVDRLTLLEIKNLYDRSNGINSACSVNIMELSSIDSIVFEDIIRLASLDEDRIADAFKKDNRVLIYKYNDSNEPNTVRALEIVTEVKAGLYKCNVVKFRYGFSREYGKKVEFLQS